MQLSSRILTALAVLILAVAVVAVRAGSPGTVEAATGTIDVLNVGTCYTNNVAVFGVGDCDDGDDDAYNVAGRDSISETGSVYATYAHDPKTAPDDPRAVLVNSNLLKISITDTGRDMRTPVLLGTAGTDGGVACSVVSETDGDPCHPGNDFYSSHIDVIRADYAHLDEPLLGDGTGFEWARRGDNDASDTITLPVGTDDAVVATGFSIVKAGTTPPAYKPMYVVDGDDSPISLYGTFTSGEQNVDPVFMNLSRYLAIDEDVGSGRVMDESGNGEDEVAPWFSVKPSIPDGASITLLYVVYETSEFESLVGGSTYGAEKELPDGAGFTKDEKRSETTALVVEARSDGRISAQNLALRETSRFSGRYEGYLQLTDENGIGGDANGEGADSWGIDTASATRCEARTGCDSMMNAAVLGVESGPVVIAYKDTDGATRTFEVSIDTTPPIVQVDQPEHGIQIQDLSPEFSGSYTDDDSGLREDSFRAYLDHQEDLNENGVDGRAVLDLRVDMPDGEYGTVQVVSGKSAVESAADYAGYPATGGTFGVIPHGMVFDLETNDSSDQVRSIDGDPHDDGALSATFGDSIRVGFKDENYNDTIDFQALVADVAGNIGFSDSDAAGPRFINDLSEAAGDRKTGRYNVLGWYARHIFFLDEQDPVIFQEQSVTGFYGENSSDVPQANRSGVLVAFDRAVDEDSISLDTFTVMLDSGDMAQIMDVNVDGRAVYLLLSEELSSDATPTLDIASGKWVSDPAGNRLTGGNQAAFSLNDGIAPRIMVSLSEGSGSGEGAEGPSMLTKNSILVSVTSDEEINSTPSISVVCSNIAWDSDDDQEHDKGLSDLVGMRSGSLMNSNASFTSPASYDCGSDYSDIDIQQVQTYSRPGLEWEYLWVNFGGSKALRDGKLTVVAYARDRKSYSSLMGRGVDALPTPADRYSWGAGTAEFRYDTMLSDPMPIPGAGTTVTEPRPFVMLTYSDASTVSVSDFSIDGTVQDIETLGGNRFLYWPETLAIGTHTVVANAVDAAGNTDSFTYSFKSAERQPFDLKLIAGWNAVSFPANPVDPMIENVFTAEAVDMVAGWDASDPEKPWSIATRMDGEWTTNDEHGTLNRVHSQYGYWVHSQGFLTQRVQLVGGIDRTDPSVVPADLVRIPTLPGWNFVGVIDQDGDQTQNNYGEALMNRDENGDQTTVSAGHYLGANRRAYTWDPIRSKFDVLDAGDSLEIGTGVWVYFGDSIAP